MKKAFAWIMAIILFVSFLPGCGEKETKQPELTQTQRQSLAMLNYLTALSQEISISNNNRLFLEEAYAELFNNSLPDAVDAQTLEHINELVDAMHGFRMIEEKREYLDYLYQQERANILTSKLPDPGEVLEGLVTGASTVIGGDKKEIVTVALEGLVYVGNMILSEQRSEELEAQQLKDGWELSAEAENKLHELRKNAFNYMLTVVNDNNIPGEYTLTEKLVEDFVKWKNNENLTGRIQFLESNQSAYRMFGDYWLTLASSCYLNGDYQKCVDAIHEYENVYAGIKIFRKDYNYAKTLPMYLLSVRKVNDESKYIEEAKEYLGIILANCDDDDWVNRYFVVECYVELSDLTKDQAYLQKAYEVMKNVVNTLMAQQQELNKLYLAEIKQANVADDADDSQKQDAAQYNQMLEELRKTELPPISEPLRICAEMLFALADKLDVSEEERNKITNILHNDGMDAFYNLIYDTAIRLEPDSTDTPVAKLTVEYQKDGIVKLPVILLTKNSCVKVSVGQGDEMTLLDEWELSHVERQGDDVETFLAVFKSEKAKSFKGYKNDMDLAVQVYASPESKEPDYTIKYKVIVDTKLWIITTVSFQRLS